MLYSKNKSIFFVSKNGSIKKISDKVINIDDIYHIWIKYLKAESDFYFFTDMN